MRVLVDAVTSLVVRGAPAGMGTRAVRHVVAGGVGTLIYMAGVAILVEIMGMHPVPSAVIAFVTLEIYIYLINRVWVYESTRDHGYVIPRFLVVTFVGLFLNTALMYVIVEVMALWYVWGLVITTVVVPPTNFLLNLYWAFK